MSRLLDSGALARERLLELAVLACETKPTWFESESKRGIRWREELLGRLELKARDEASLCTRVKRVREAGAWRPPWEPEKDVDDLWSMSRAYAPFTPRSGRLAVRALSRAAAGGLGSLVLAALGPVPLIIGLGWGWMELLSAAIPGYLKARNHRVLARYRLPEALLPDERHGLF